MFLENKYARPLFALDGGPPRAFECIVNFESIVNVQYKKELHVTLGKDGTRICGKITQTESGMRSHLRTVHEWEEQSCLYSTGRQSDQSQKQSKKLRVCPDSRSQEKPEEENIVTKDGNPLVSQNVEELQKPTRKEK